MRLSGSAIGRRSMPEMRFTIRWPDGRQECCYSPSLVIKEHLEPGESYLLADFLDRSSTALGIASDRVRAKYGFPCTRALGQLALIEQACARYSDQADARVLIEFFEE